MGRFKNIPSPIQRDKSCAMVLSGVEPAQGYGTETSTQLVTSGRLQRRLLVEGNDQNILREGVIIITNLTAANSATVTLGVPLSRGMISRCYIHSGIRA